MEEHLEGGQPSNGGGLSSPTATAKDTTSAMMPNGRRKRSKEELEEPGPVVLTDNVSVFLLISRIP